MADWRVYDRLLHDLGAVRAAVDTVEGTPVGVSVEAHSLRKALDDASGAVHLSLDVDDDATLHAAWAAMAVAQDMVRTLGPVIEAAHRQRERARQMRSLAARQREAARTLRRARGYPGGNGGDDDGH